MKKTPEFGYLATTQDQLAYMLLEELRKNNELLQKLVEQKEVKEDAPVRRTRNKNSQGTE